MSKSSSPYQRPYASELARRLAEPRRFIQVVAGSRQIAKTTLVQQVVAAAGVPVRYGSADQPTVRGAGWIAALSTATAGLAPGEVRADREFQGRLVEFAVGAHLANAAACGACELFYWRERTHELDFVARAGRRLVGIEVKSGRRRDALPGMEAFAQAFRPARRLLIGADGITLEEFLSRPVESWLAA